MRCDICGKFRKMDDLRIDGTPDYEDGSGNHSEDLYWICKECDKPAAPKNEQSPVSVSQGP